MTSLAERSRATELMDTEPVSFEEFRHTLQQLEVINRWTFTYRPTIRWLDRLVRARRPDRPISILDIGFGHGDMLRRIAAWAERRSVPVRLSGIDLNPFSTRAAALATPAELQIRYETGNAFDIAPDRELDIVISSQLTHHLSDAELVRFITWMDRQARIGWLINDLHRHPIPYHFIGTATRLVAANRLIRHDAPVSVARGFTRREWRRLLDESGVPADRSTIEWYFPFRWAVGAVR